VADKAGDQALTGGGSTAVHRRGDVVLRQGRPWSPTVVELLRHLEREGFDGAPRVVGDGIDDDGRETLAYIDGESPHPYGWADDAVAEIGALVRDLHRASASFTPPADVVWMPWFGRDLEGSPRLIGHCDVAPWNILARDGRPVALIDWDTAGPVGLRTELAQAVWLNAQLHDDDVAERLGLPGLSARAAQARLILDGYGLPTAARAGFVDAMIGFAVTSAAQEAIDAGIARAAAEPRSMGRLGGGQPLAGHELLWAMAWRIRSAAWMVRNRGVLQRAIG
jgi:Phosphotransferase enzyme family